MKARLITRCGCERTIEVSFPPPPGICLPLTPPKTNEGLIRPWMDPATTWHYDPKRDGLARREFRLSSDSLHEYYDRDKDEVWYDEITDHDPPGFNAALRTYAPAKLEGTP